MCVHGIYRKGNCVINIHDEKGNYIGAVACPKDTIAVSSSGTCIFADTKCATYVYECADGHPHQVQMFYH